MMNVTEISSEQVELLQKPDADPNLETENKSPFVSLFIRRSRKTFDPSLSIPQTSDERLREAAHDHALDIDILFKEHGTKSKLRHTEKPQNGYKGTDKPEETVLYLAYGSNMSIQTFRKSRGIVPISQLNVYVPDLSLTFDLLGLPYIEPCMAATKFRSPKPSILESDLPQPSETHQTQAWHKPLVGIVYEVTLSDYAHIIATEGGGSSYIDIAVDCYAFPKSYKPTDPVPSYPDKLSKPFKAHTLLSPSAKDEIAAKLSTATSVTKRISQASSRFTRSHPPGNPAQPSPRYKNLLVTGAREHNLPIEYRAYLSSITAYRITTTRQRIGKYVTMMMWGPPLLLSFMITTVVEDKRGRMPWWASVLQRWLFAAMWWWYDFLARPVFGEGRRTALKL
ncbi:hypothetical protein GX48_05582 [Paracoccidioides brasiliensis]|nr:hypothetical protein GX48_05582 [Paracoccidioides brasiliensis]